MATHSISRLQLSAIPASTLNRTKPISQSSSISFPLLSHSAESSWLLTFGFPLQSLKPKSISPLVRPVAAAVSLSLPTANPEKVKDEKQPQWSSRAIKSFAMGELEARKLKYPTTGTEALLMGILIEGTSLAAKLLRAYGITLTKVKEESIKLVGKGDLYFFSPEHPPLTDAAQRALDWAVEEKLRSGEEGEITTTDLLMGVWSEKESPGQKILAALGFDEEKAKKLKSLSSEPGFSEG